MARQLLRQKTSTKIANYEYEADESQIWYKYKGK